MSASPPTPARRRTPRRLIVAVAAGAAAVLGVGLAVVPASAATDPVSVDAVADTYVTPLFPDQANGTLDHARVDEDGRMALYKFDVPANPEGAELVDAELVLHVLDGPALPVDVHTTGNTWGEGTTWADRPSLNADAGSAVVGAGDTLRVSIPTVTPGSKQSVALTRSVAGDPQKFGTREQTDPALRPQLVLTYQDADTRLADAVAAAQAAEVALQADPADLESARTNLSEALALVNDLLGNTPPSTTEPASPSTTEPVSTAPPPPTTEPPPPTSEPASTTSEPPTTTSPAPDPVAGDGYYKAGSFIYSRVDGSGVPIDSARTSSFRSFMASHPDQGGKGITWPKVNMNESWAMSYAYGKAGDPVWKLRGGNTDNSRLQILTTQGFHMPDSVASTFPSGTQDRPGVIFDEAFGYTVQFADAVPDLATHTITVSNAGIMWHGSNGLDYRNPASDDDRNFTSRGRILDSMIVTREDLDRAVAAGTGVGKVLHLYFVETNSADGVVHPMVGAESGQSGWGAEGERVRLKPGIDLEARGLTGYALALARTFQENGAYIGDNSGSATQVKLSQASHYTGTNLSTDVFEGKINWNDFEVVQQGWQ